MNRSTLQKTNTFYLKITNFTHKEGQVVTDAQVGGNVGYTIVDDSVGNPVEC